MVNAVKGWLINDSIPHPLPHEWDAQVNLPLAQVEQLRAAVVDDYAQVCVQRHGQQLRAPVQPRPARNTHLHAREHAQQL